MNILIRATLARNVGVSSKITRFMSSDISITNSKQLEKEIKVVFGSQKVVKTSPGKSLYDVVMENNLDFDGFGSCGATLCCTTCHLIIKESDYNKLQPPSEEELNMLDLAEGLCDTSRLGCQVILPKNIDSLEVEVPPNLTDARTG